jgi:hypothetical protein
MICSNLKDIYFSNLVQMRQPSITQEFCVAYQATGIYVEDCMKDCKTKLGYAVLAQRNTA